MAWRISELLIEGVLDNTENGKVVGRMKFAGMTEDVKFELDGNFHRDIRGAKVRIFSNGETACKVSAEQYMEGFAVLQNGKVGDMTAGLEPSDYVEYPYFEWYSKENGRCVIELNKDQIELLSKPIPAIESDPISRKDQAENMAEFMCQVAEGVGVPAEMAVIAGDTVVVEQAKKVVQNNKIRGMNLLTKEIRGQLPELYAQDGKGGEAVVHVKFFTPDANWTWLATEGSPVKDESGNELDFQFFGLVDGHEKELGHFYLSELESVNGPMGLPIERDLYFSAKPLKEIAPEMFKEAEDNE